MRHLSSFGVPSLRRYRANTNQPTSGGRPGDQAKPGVNVIWTLRGRQRACILTYRHAFFPKLIPGETWDLTGFEGINFKWGRRLYSLVWLKEVAFVPHYKLLYFYYKDFWSKGYWDFRIDQILQDLGMISGFVWLGETREEEKKIL